MIMNTKQTANMQTARKRIKNVNTQRNRNALARRRKPRRDRNKKRTGPSNGPYDIGVIKNAPTITRCIRYQTDNFGDCTFTSVDMLQWCGFATSTTAGYSIIEAIRIKRVKLTLIPDHDQNYASCSFKWLGTNAPHDEMTMVAMPAVPSTANFYPPEDANATWWHSTFSTAQSLFSFDEVTLVDSALLDIEFEYVMLADNTSNALSTLSGATANTIVYPLQPTTSTRIFRPVGLPSG